MHIIYRWQQFGKRLFLPHLMLGMLAACLGMSPYTVEQSLQRELESTALSSSTNHINDIKSDRSQYKNWNTLRFRQINQWHRQAIYRLLSRLSQVMAPSVSSSQQAISIEQSICQVADKLFATLSSSAPKSTMVRGVKRGIPFLQYKTENWLSSVLGIRAGPVFIYN